jgi:hypothetical protein
MESQPEGCDTRSGGLTPPYEAVALYLRRCSDAYAHTHIICLPARHHRLVLANGDLCSRSLTTGRSARRMADFRNRGSLTIGIEWRGYGWVLAPTPSRAARKFRASTAATDAACGSPPTL